MHLHFADPYCHRDSPVHRLDPRTKFILAGGCIHFVDLADAGRRVAESNLGRVRAQVGLVFQSPDDQLFSPTVFEDVAFGPIYQGLPEAEVRQRVDEALAAVQMSGFAWRVSHHLSVGEKKRIAIATVLSMRPGILVMDEPSAGPGLARPARTD